MTTKHLLLVATNHPYSLNLSK